MSDHRIRLRGGWIGEFAGGSVRITLPTSWLADRPDCKFKLRRSFRLPAIEASQSLHLVLEKVAGLVGIELDDEQWSSRITGSEPFSIEMAAFPPRRVTLTLEVDPGLWPLEFEETDRHWGLVELLIRER